MVESHKKQPRTYGVRKAASLGAIFAVSAGSLLTATVPAMADEDARLALEVLEEIEIRSAYDGDDYERSDWGGWERLEDTGCTTQQTMLIRDTIPDTQVLDEEDNCILVYGATHSPYTMEYIEHDRTSEDFTRTPFDIDHVVSIHDAWRSGGHEWDAEQREAFYNDTENLVATDFSSNRRKGNRDISEYLPEDQGQYCEFASTVVYVKDKYNLSMTQAEHDVAFDILSDADCEDTNATPAVTMTYNYIQAEQEAEEPTEEPSDEPTDTPSDEPTEDSSDEPTETPTPEPTPEVEIQPVESLEPVVIDEGTTPTDNASGEDISGYAQDPDVEIQPVEPLEPVIIDEGEDIADIEEDENMVLSDQELRELEAEGDVVLEYTEDMERLADAGPTGVLGVLTALGTLAIGLGAFFMKGGQILARRKH